jgi:DNA excision repair protein ERCC-3
VKPITIATYSILTAGAKTKAMKHFDLLCKEPWGIVVYDEVHLLPAPVFRLSAALQATRRLAADNPRKDEVVRELVQMHQDDQILVIGTYLQQLDRIASVLNAPLLTGETSHPKREELYAAFRTGEVRVLVVSRVANFAIDLPDASVLIQVAGTFGSRQEEAQRLGRILRPKTKHAGALAGGGAWFYTLVSQGTEEVEWARNRQRFLAEQGYGYEIEGLPAERVGT